MSKTKESIDSNLHEIAPHGNMEYPISVYHMKLSQMYMEYVRWHWHEELEFNMILKGVAELYIGNERIRCTKGQGFMINQNVLHSIHALENEECLIYSVLFHPSYLFGYGNILLSVKYQLPILDAASYRYYIMDEQNPEQNKLLAHMQKIIELNTMKQYGYELYTKSELCILWLCLLQQITPSPDISEERTSISMDEMRVKSAMEFIEGNYMLPLSLEEISASVNLSKSECCRCFKRTLNLTPFEYLIKYRIFSAAQKIQKKDPDAASISALAAAVGFNNTSYFNKQFKKYINCTPKIYRNSSSSSDSLAVDVFGVPIHFK